MFHIESGEAIQSDTLIPQNVQLAKMNEFQVLGSAITYIRRYALSSMLGLVTDKDTDASGEQVRTPEKRLYDAVGKTQQIKTVAGRTDDDTEDALSEIKREEI